MIRIGVVLTAAVEDEHEDEHEHGVGHGQVVQEPPPVADPVARREHGGRSSTSERPAARCGEKQEEEANFAEKEGRRKKVAKVSNRASQHSAGSDSRTTWIFSTDGAARVGTFMALRGPAGSASGGTNTRRTSSIATYAGNSRSCSEVSICACC